MNQSFLERQPFLIEKGSIPMVYFIPVTAELPNSELAKKDYAKNLLKLDGNWFSLKDWKEVRKSVEERIAKNAA